MVTEGSDTAGRPARRLGLAPGVFLREGVSRRRARDDLHGVGLAAPTAPNLLHDLLERPGFLHGGLPRQVEMPELLDPGPADDIEPREVSAVSAAPAMTGIGDGG